MDETTTFFARMAAAYFIVTGLGLLISTRFYARMVRENENTDPVTLNLSGAVHFLVGLSIVLRHWRWGSIAEALVTLIGLAAMLKGTALIVIPEQTLKSPKTSEKALRFTGLGFVVVGGYLAYASFVS